MTVEIVRLMIESLQRAGIERLHVDLGNPAIYRAFAAELGGEAEELFHAVQQKDAMIVQREARLHRRYGSATRRMAEGNIQGST